MIVTLKTLQEDTFTVEIDPSQTVRKFKEKIEKVKGHDFPAKHMKLMYAGKFLVDGNRVCDYNVEEKKFVIVVVKKPKTVVKEEEPESSSSSSRERIPFMNGRRGGSDQDFLCANHEQLVHHITELGFSRNDVEAALRASYNNPDRAVEYLISGSLPSSSDNNDADMDPVRNPDRIPDSSDAQLLRHISLTGPPSPGSSSLPNQERIFQLFSEAMSDCQQHTRLADSMMEEDHDLITQTFSEMEAANLHSTLSGDRASASLSPDSMPETMSSCDRMFDVWNDTFNSTEAMGFAGNLQDRDHEAIERLKQLGFSDHKAIEAYFVCERNENAAADYLFSSQNFE